MLEVSFRGVGMPDRLEDIIARTVATALAGIMFWYVIERVSGHARSFECDRLYDPRSHVKRWAALTWRPHQHRSMITGCYCFNCTFGLGLASWIFTCSFTELSSITPLPHLRIPSSSSPEQSQSFLHKPSSRRNCVTSSHQLMTSQDSHAC